MITERNLERRCRYELAKHRLCCHKIPGNNGPVYYVYEDGSDDAIPEDQYRFMTLHELNDYCGELANNDSDR